MSASPSLYHSLHRQLAQVAASVPEPSRIRLALLVTGIVAAGSCVQARIARELDALGLTQATGVASIGRRLRRTLNDAHLTVEGCYADLVRRLVPTQPVGCPTAEPVVLALDESTKEDRIHLLRMSLTYRGGSVPIAWAAWEQNVAQAPGAYWQAIDTVLAATAARLPANMPVIVLADRAYAVPNLIDRLRARGWHWAIRIMTTGSHRWKGTDQPDLRVGDLVAAQLPHPGTRFRASGAFAKKAGWRSANLVGIWGRGQEAPLVVVTDLPKAWNTLRLYARRFWIEPGFRLDKRAGWDWETCQVRALAHHAVLLLALAWASVVVICLGASEAARMLARLAERPRRARPRCREHARHSLATLGQARVRHWLYHPPDEVLAWSLPARDNPSWNAEWLAAQIRSFIFPPVRP